MIPIHPHLKIILPLSQSELENCLNIALVGYGKMGQIVEQVALRQDHRITARFDINNNPDSQGLTAETLQGAEVAIEFSTPESVVRNIEQLLELSIPVVVGTTGWYDRMDEVREMVARTDGALVYGPNFSPGVNLFFQIVEYAAARLSPFMEFDPYLIELHHRLKLDAPSGTALKIEETLHQSYGRRTPHAVSIRAGHIPGTHEVGFDSPAETIQIIHTARNRESFASGAIVAAELIRGNKGIHLFSDLLFSRTTTVD